MDFNEQLSLLAGLFRGWGVGLEHWVLVDGHALYLQGISHDLAIWRTHLNVYVNELTLPWSTREKEETLPPLDSTELGQFLQAFDAGLVLHLIPAQRYFKRNFEFIQYALPSGEFISVVTLVGQIRLWLWRAFEFASAVSEYEDTECREIARTRCDRLKLLLQHIAPLERDLLQPLLNGYSFLSDGRAPDAVRCFEEAEKRLQAAFPHPP